MRKNKRTTHFRKRMLFLLASLLLLLGLTATAHAATTVGKATITKVKTMSSDKHRVYWKAVSKASGYQLRYRAGGASKFSSQLISGGSTTHGDVTSRLPGVNYSYQVRAYRTVKKKKVYGAWSALRQASINKSIAVYGKEVSYETYGRFFKKEAEARKNMTTIQVKTWDFAFGKSGKKITVTHYVMVNKKVAESLKRAFKEIYNNSGKFPIYYIGGWRWGQSRSEHCDGTAIDINPNENYQVRNKKAIVGSYWKPGKDPYSIPKDGKVAKILKKYGFTQGIWSSSQDYMHFSYFGT